jgi:hypothetical protein
LLRYIFNANSNYKAGTRTQKQDKNNTITFPPRKKDYKTKPEESITAIIRVEGHK